MTTLAAEEFGRVGNCRQHKSGVLGRIEPFANGSIVILSLDGKDLGTVEPMGPCLGLVVIYDALVVRTKHGVEVYDIANPAASRLVMSF